MARNYMESGALAEPDPINAFHKAPNAVIGPDETMVLPDVAASNFECEAEIAVVIGKRASHVAAADAMAHVVDRQSTRLNSSHSCETRMPSSACKKKRQQKPT